MIRSSIAPFLTEPSPRRLARRLFAVLAARRGLVLGAVALSVAVAVIDLAGPYLIRRAIDRDLAAHDLRGLAQTSTWYLLATLLSAVVRHLYVLAVERTAQQLTGTMRRQVHGHIQNLSIADVERRPAGELMARVTADVDALRGLFTSSLLGTIADVASLVAILAMLIALDVRMALLTLLPVPLALLVARRLRRRGRIEHHASSDYHARINAFAQEHLSGMLAVQLFQRERTSRARLDELNAGQVDSRTRLGRTSARLSLALDLLIASMIVLLIGLGGRELLAGTLTLGSLIATIQYAERFWRLVSHFCEQASTLQGPAAAAERVFALLDTPLPAVPATAVRRVPAAAAIRFDRVWFAYDQPAADRDPDRAWDPDSAPASALEPAAATDRWVLRDISFTVPPGRFVALVGMTGAGKSSIVNLLSRFYIAQRGRVLVDAVDVRDYDPRSLRSGLVLIPQDVRLFTGTIADNIRLGMELSDADMRAAARAAHAHRFIEALPHGYATLVGERGGSLSAGQQQLIVFARALARQPRTLILDEPASLVDDEATRVLGEALRTQRERRTIVMVAHRLSTIEDADEILVIHHGQLWESGTHAELLRRNGIYARLAELQ